MFDDFFERILDQTDISNISELARALEIQPSSVQGAKKRGTVPPRWIGKLAEKYGLRRKWLLHGEGAPSKNYESQPELTHQADTLKDLIHGDLRLQLEEAAQAGGISPHDLYLMMDRKKDIPASVIRKWVNQYRINANFLIAQIGYPLLTEEQFLEHGPLSWVREKNREDIYPANAESPAYPQTRPAEGPKLGLVSRIVAAAEQGQLAINPEASEHDILEAVIPSLIRRRNELEVSHNQLGAREKGTPYLAQEASKPYGNANACGHDPDPPITQRRTDRTDTTQDKAK